jgi:hypothetical protein
MSNDEYECAGSVFTGLCVRLGVGSREAEAESDKFPIFPAYCHSQENTTIIMSEGTTEKKGKFEPKNPVKLDPPKDDPISAERLAKCDGRQDRSQMPVT